MPPTTATTTYKKKDGTLAVQADKKYVHWTPAAPPNSSPSVTIPTADITNLQQTPAAAKSVALKIVVKEDGYVFSFTHKENARKEQETVTDILREALKVRNDALLAKSEQPSGSGTPAQAGSGNEQGASAAMAIAKAVSSKAADEGWYDDSKLESDLKLQRSLLESNKALKDRFNQSLKEKPESVSITQFTAQFWSARLHLLRGHAIETAQKQGEYNVLPTIQYVRKEGEEGLTLNMHKEQIKLIFKQYPVVRDAYNENVPPLKPNDFWSRFFGSRLLKKMKGERIHDYDARDAILDKYLDRSESSTTHTAHIPHWMDLEGNEQNHSQQKGNRPDEDMRPSGNDKAPILRILNNLSEKLMSHVAPEDSEAHAPIGMDEETFEQLRLRDLAEEDIDNRIVLNIREQQRYAGGSQDDLSKDAKLYAQQDPEKVLSMLQKELGPSHLGADEKGTLRLDRVLGYHSDDDSDDDEDPQANGTAKNASARIGSHAAMSSASTEILSSIRLRRQAEMSDASSLNGLSQAIYDQLTMTHNTTTEFLHYFWSLFLSGDASRTNELAQLVSTLERSMDRIIAVSDAAEAERQKYIETIKEGDQRYFEQTRKRRRRGDWSQVKGGRQVVEAMIKPTIQALAQATSAYKKAFEEQTKEANAALAAVG